MAIKQKSRRLDLHARFLLILPRINLHARIAFRHLPPGPKRDDALAEATGLAWKWYVRLVERGKDPHKFPSTLASYATRAVRSGRKVCGQEKAKDVLSPLAQQRHHFSVESLPSSTAASHQRLGTIHGQRHVDAYEDRLKDNTLTPVPEQAAFRVDWPTWLATRTARDREIIQEMGKNERTQDLASKFGVSPARISQLRRDYHQDWCGFCEDAPSETPMAPAATS